MTDVPTSAAMIPVRQLAHGRIRGFQQCQGCALAHTGHTHEDEQGQIGQREPVRSKRLPGNAGSNLGRRSIH